MAECKRLSFTFSDTSASTPGQSNPEITVTPPESGSPPRIPPHAAREDARIPAGLVEEVEEEEDERAGDEESGGSDSLASDEAESEWERAESQRDGPASGADSVAPSLCSESQLSTVAPEDVFLDHAVAPEEDDASELKPLELDMVEHAWIRQGTAGHREPYLWGVSLSDTQQRGRLIS